MLRNFLARFEDLNWPLLGPNIWALQTFGLWQPKSGITNILSNSFHSITALYISTEFVELWILRSNYNSALRNLSYSLLSLVCLMKVGTFVIWQNDWKDIFNYIKDLEKRQRSRKDDKTDIIIDDYTKYSRQVTFFYWCLTTSTVFTVIIFPFVGFLSTPQIRMDIRNGTTPYPEIMSSWFPFDKSRGYGYIASFLIQATIFIWGGGVVGSYDSTAVTIMAFIVGQLKILRVNCERVFGDETEIVTEDEAIERIKNCHKEYVTLIKYCKVFNSLLSPVMFLYIIICSLMICASATRLTMDGPSNLEKIWQAEYLMALIFQLFLFCWHSNEVLYMSKNVNYAVFSSTWWSRSARARRFVHLLNGLLAKNVVFTLGPFATLDVATFLVILKGSYSYYTLLNNNEDNH